MPESQSGSERRLVRDILDFIRKNGMFADGEGVLLAVSGGADSTAMAWLMGEIAPMISLRLGIAHLNHRLRGDDSDRDEAFARDLARRMSLPFFSDRQDVKRFARENRLSSEEAGREVRLAFLRDTARRHGYSKIALAHHADDNAELVLMFLLRGAGPAGLSGMVPVAADGVVHPLLGVSRSDILEYLTENGLDFVTDASNSDVRFTRNRVRHQLIPLLQKDYNPRIALRLNDLAAVLRDEEDWLRGVTAGLLAGIVTAERADTIILSVPGIRALLAGASRRVIRETLHRLLGNLRRITFSHVEAIRRLAHLSTRGYGELHLPQRVRVIREGDALAFRRETACLRQPAPDFDGFRHVVAGPGVTALPEIGKRLRIDIQDAAASPHDQRPEVAHLDLERLGFPMTIRNRMPGDRFRPLGMTGTRKLKDFFIDAGISRTLRDRCPILVWRDRIVWVTGHRIAEDFKVTPATRKVVKAELLLA